MFQWIKNYIDKQVKKEVKERIDREVDWRYQEINELKRKHRLILSEEFIDEVVERLNKKQLK